MARPASSPNSKGRLENRLHRENRIFAGVDEVGRGCLAGPVHAACVVIDWVKLNNLPSSYKSLIRDSKQLSANQRIRVVPVIESISLCFNVASASVEEINQLGILPACFLAMRRAVEACGPIDTLLVDGKLPIPAYEGPQLTVVKGDSLCYSIAAASILAKTARDSFMIEQGDRFPEFGFSSHVGYGTRAHLDNIAAHGICELHRRTFAPIREYVKSTTP